MKQRTTLLFHMLRALVLVVLMCQCSGEKTETPLVQAVLETPDGGFWAATDNGLYRADSLGVLRQQPLPSLTRHPFPSIHALAFDTLYGRLWVGAWNHLYCYDLNRERFVTTADSAIHQTVALQCDTLGRVSARTEHGLYRYTLCDTLPDGLTEQIDGMVYKKADLTDIDLKGFRFPKPKSAPLSLWLLFALTGMGAVSFLFALLIWRRRQHTKIPSEKTSEAGATSIDNTDKLQSTDVLPAKLSFLQRAEQVVDKHIADEDFNADLFAREMAVSRAQLFRKLKAANGQTPKDFIDERRMARATHLLQTTDRTVSDIAMACGYSDASNFRRSFVRTFGVTPSDFRAKIR